MPIYEYGCNDCGTAHEARQKFSDPPLKTCPACNKDGLERMISNSSFSLKGSGWYADGYGDKKPDEKKTDGGKADNKSSSPSTSKAESKDSDKSTDTTPKKETKAETKPAPKKD